MTEFEDYSCFGSTISPLQPYASCHECLQQSRFWVPGCDLCLPAVCDHLSWATILAWPTGWSLYTGFTVPRRRLDRLRVLANERALVEARLAGFAQQWLNLLGECWSSKILWSGVLFKWKCHQPPLIRMPIQFLTRNKKRATEDHRQPAEEWGLRASPQELLPGLLQQAVSCSLENWISSSCYRSVHSEQASSGVPHFQIETAQTISAAVGQEKWTVSIDIKDASPHTNEPISGSVSTRRHVSSHVYRSG